MHCSTSNTGHASRRNLALTGILALFGLGAGGAKPADAREPGPARDDEQRLARLEREFTTLAGRYDQLTEDFNHLSQVAPPIGSVSMWWGGMTRLPDGWESCDGKEVVTQGAMLKGVKPNLVDRFPKGARPDRQGIADLVAKGMGGSHNIPSLVLRHFENLQVTGGEHSHSVRVRTGHDAHAGTPDHIVARGEDNHVHDHVSNGWADPGGSGHSHGFGGFLGKAGGIETDGTDATGANQPAYSELFFIIRVK